MRPTHDRVFVERKQQEETTASGFILPGGAGSAEDEGIVIAVGNGKTYENGLVVPLTVKVGDKVLFSKHAGQTTKLDGKEIMVMREDDIFAIID